MILNKQILPQFFEIADQHNSHFLKPTNTYEFVNRGSSILCVTIGDSWTWGSDLAERLETVYGNQLSKMMDADWLNLAIPGVGNHWIASKVVELNRIVDKIEYDSIFVFCTFTEIGRQLDSQFDRHIDYLSWYKDQVNFNLFNFLLMLNQDAVSIINHNSNRFDKVVIRSNWVEPIGYTGKSWLSLISNYNDVCYCSLHGLDNLVGKKLLDLMPFTDEEKILHKAWSIEMIDIGEKRNKMISSIDNFKNYHPTTKDQHGVWAKELLGVL